MMNKPTIYLSILLATLFVGFGCKKNEAPAGAPEAPIVVKSYSPLIPQDTMLVFYNKEKKLFSGAMGKFLLSEQERQSKEIEKFYSEAPEEVEVIPSPKKYFDFCFGQLKKVDWTMITVGSPNDDFLLKIIDAEDITELPEISCVSCYSEKITFETMEEVLTNACPMIFANMGEIMGGIDCDIDYMDDINKSFQVEKTEVAGCKVFQVSFKDAFVAEEEPSLKKLDICAGVFDERLFIVASSQKVFERTIDLYKGTIAALPADAPMGKEILQDAPAFSGGIFGIDKIIDRSVKFFLSEEDPDAIAEEQKEVKETYPVCDAKYTCILDDAEMSVQTSFKVGFLTEEKAAEFCKQANSMLPLAAFALSGVYSQFPSLSFIKDIFDGVKISNQGKDVILDVKAKKETIEKIDYCQLLKDLSSFQEEKATFGPMEDDVEFDEDGTRQN